MIDLNVTLLIQMGNFLVLLFLMNMILYGPIRRVVKQREQHVLREEEGIRHLQMEAIAALEGFDAKILEARKEGRQRIQELKVAAHDEEKNMLQEATEEGARQVQKIRESVQKEVASARHELRGQVQSFSVELAQKILGRSL